MRTPIAIVGEGIVCALGIGKAEVYGAMRSDSPGVGLSPAGRYAACALPVGCVRITDGEMKAELGIPLEKPVPRSALLGMMAAEEALADAGLTREPEGTRETSRWGRAVLVNGTTVGGMDLTEAHYAEMKEAGAHADLLRSHDPGAVTQAVAGRFGFFSGYTTVSTACSSAANAIMLGARLLEAGEADICVAGGTEALTRFHAEGFRSLMVLDGRRCRPFDASRAGLNLGEGAAFIVMMREGDALARGLSPHAYLAGYGNACDAFHQTASSPDAEGAFRAMTLALAGAGLAPADIDYVNAHGTGTENNDLAESRALRRVFGEELPPVSSTKPLTGHATSAAGGIEAVLCIMALQHGLMPANLGFATPFEGGIRPLTRTSRKALRHVMSNSFGFGGNCCSLVFSDASPSTRRAGGGLDTRFTILELSRIHIGSTDELKRLKRFVPPMELRRLSPMLRGALLSSLEALEVAGVERPDAIVMATHRGPLSVSERLLDMLTGGDGPASSPALFALSTHNTAASLVAIRTGCHGYNVTYSQQEASLDHALADARLLLQSGMARTVLVGIHDESAPVFNAVLSRAGHEALQEISCTAIVLGAEPPGHSLTLCRQEACNARLK